MGVRMFLFRIMLGVAVGASTAVSSADPEYLVFVTSEAADRVALIRFGSEGARVVRDRPVGVMPIEIDGPHGLTVSPDGRFYYVSLAHGQPFGNVLKLATGDDRVVGRATLGMFPASMDTTPDGDFLYVVNFNLHGDMVPSSVSVVATDEMVEIARPRTCRMPHGSRVNPQGTRHYSACMMDDLLVEIDTATLGVSRHFVLTKGKELGAAGPPAPSAGGPGHPAGHESRSTQAACSPTWAQPSPDGSNVYVACNASDEIVEVDAASWVVRRRLPAGPGVYNLATTKNRRLLATNKRGQSVSVFDLVTGREVARIPTTRRVVHGVDVSSDDRYAFVSVEGIAQEPGTVEVIDLAALKVVATVDVGQQAAGIDFWKMEP